MNRHAALGWEPWAISRAALDGILARIDGLTMDLFADAPLDKVEAMYAARSAAPSGGIAVVPVSGPITRHDTMLSLIFGGTSADRLSAQLRALANDDSVSTILLNIDSPGGEAQGMHELAATIRRVRETKRVVALANPMMASAAAWLGWSAHEVIATPDAIVGSQGVFAVHIDTSQALETAGIKVTYIGSSDAKTGGQEGLPLDDDSRAEMQAIINEVNRLFVADVAAGRGITPAKVTAQFGNGAAFHARDAKQRGMVDRVAGFNETIARLSGAKPAGMRAEGGPLLAGTPYVVGEHGEEEFVPAGQPEPEPTIEPQDEPATEADGEAEITPEPTTDTAAAARLRLDADWQYARSR